MRDLRVFLPAAPASDVSEITLAGGEAHHLVTVNRARVGDVVVAFDGSGREWACAFAGGDGKRGARLTVQTRQEAPAPRCRIVLGQGLPKGGTMDDIVRQATELGVATIVPLVTTRSEVRVGDERADKKREKWRVVAIEAAKQCGNPFLPVVAPVSGLDDFLAGSAAAAAELKLIASLHPGAVSLRGALAAFREREGGRAPATVAWLVGPEGDLTGEEVAAALAQGWIPVSLGPLVLRCDTAATFALSVIRAETEG